MTARIVPLADEHVEGWRGGYCGSYLMAWLC